MRILSLIFLVFLSGCSTVCFVANDTDISEITTLQLHWLDDADEQFYELINEVNESCETISEYSHSDGGMFSSVIQPIQFFCINCKPRCLYKKAIRDLRFKKGNLVIDSTSLHSGETWITRVSSHNCSAEIIAKIEMHNQNRKNN